MYREATSKEWTMDYKAVLLALSGLFCALTPSGAQTKVTTAASGSFSLVLGAQDRAERASGNEYHAYLGSDGIIQKIEYRETREGVGSIAGSMVLTAKGNRLTWSQGKDLDGYVKKYQLDRTKAGFQITSWSNNLDRPEEKENKNIYQVRYLFDEGKLWTCTGGYNFEYKGRFAAIQGAVYLEEDPPNVEPNTYKYVYQNGVLAAYHVLEEGKPGLEYKSTIAFDGRTARLVSTYANWKYLFSSSDQDDWRIDQSVTALRMEADNFYSPDMKVNILNDFILRIALGGLSPKWIPFVYGLAPAPE